MARGRRTVPESEPDRPWPRIIIADWFFDSKWELIIPGISRPPGRRFLLPLVLFVPGWSLALPVPRARLSSARERRSGPRAGRALATQWPAQGVHAAHTRSLLPASSSTAIATTTPCDLHPRAPARLSERPFPLSTTVQSRAHQRPHTGRRDQQFSLPHRHRT